MFVLVFVAVVIFAIARVIPGDPAVALSGEGATTAQIQALRAQLQLDEPLPIQLATYIGGLARGDLGTSLRTNRPIRQELAQRLPATLELSLSALFLALVVGIPLGVLSAIRSNRLSDHAVRILSLIGVSAPVFWLALFLQIIFSVNLNWLPVSGRIDPLLQPTTITGFLIVDGILTGEWNVVASALRHLILPALVLAAFLAGTLVRLVRVGMLDEMRQDYVRTAQAKGLRRNSVWFGHVLRNSLLPAVTIVGLKFAELLGGAILTETVFSWPGMGRYMYEAIRTRDYPVIQGATLLFAIMFIFCSLLIDLLYGYLDPRIRFR